MTIEEIEDLNPEFKLPGGMTMIDWFEVHEGDGYCVIRSGLRHADGVTKSPYHYEHALGGKNATERCLEHFNVWWDSKH
jgi:hypothetical protein